MRFITVLLCFLFTFNAYSIEQAAMGNPYNEVKRVTTTLFARLQNADVRDEENLSSVSSIVREELMPFTDHKFAAFKVLGSQFRSIPQEKLMQYINVFEKYLVVNYASVLNAYTDQAIEFLPETDFSNKKMVTVRAKITGGEGPDINIAFKVRHNRTASKWQVYDIVAEGISMVSSKQSQYSPIIRKQGIDAVIEQMNDAITSGRLFASTQ